MGGEIEGASDVAASVVRASAITYDGVDTPHLLTLPLAVARSAP